MWPSRPDLDYIPTYRTGNNGTQGMREEVGTRPEEASVPPDAPSRGTFATLDRQGAYVFLPTSDLKELRDLLVSLNVIDRMLGTEDTKSPEWRQQLCSKIDQVLKEL